MALQIITNHHERQFDYRWEVPDSVLADQFDHLDSENCDGFFQYRNTWYHTSDFMDMYTSTHHFGSHPFDGWHGYLGDSFFSGVLIKLSNDGETYQVATYIS